MRRVAITFFVFFFSLILGSTSIWAEEQIPEILSYSQLNFAVHRGDSIKLQVDASGENISAKWLKSGEIVCRELTCDVDTSDWGLGTHNVVFVVFNDKGSLFLKYKIKILTVPPGYKPGPVTPPLVEGGERIETVANDDFAVVTTLGRGFSSHNRKVQVVGPIARSMDWTEKLKTQPGSRMEVYVKDREVHHLLSNTNIVLVRSEETRRAILLRKGTLRSRQLIAESPEWSVIAGNWLQIDGDDKADFFVRKSDDKKNEFDIGVYRGRVRVIIKNTKLHQNGAVKHEFVLVPGEALRVQKGQKNEPQKLLGDQALFSKIFQESTPHYLPENLSADNFVDNHLVLSGKLQEAEKNAVEVARGSVDNLDFIVALEALRTRLTKSGNDLDALLIGTEAYIGLLQLAEAKALLSEAIKTDEEHADAPFLSAVIHIIDSKWKDCLADLDEAEDRDFANRQLLEFYRGRCEIGLGNTVGARNAFTYATWEDGQPIITKTSNDILATLDEERWILLSGKLGVGFDNNVFRISEGSTLVDDIGARESWYSNLYGAARFWPFRAKEAQVSFGLEVERRDFTNKLLKEFAVLRQGIDLEIQLNIGGDQEPAFTFSGSALIQLISVGKKRNIDTLADRLQVGVPPWWGLKLYNRNLVNSDPFPFWDDRVDAKRQEVASGTDRSSKDRAFGLSLTPIRSDYTLDIGVEDFTSNYKSSETSQENYKDLSVHLDNLYKLTPRHHLGFDLANFSRKFVADGNGRTDSVLGLRMNWVFLWNTTIRHDFSVFYESAKSSVSDYSFSRQTVQLDLGVEF